MVYNKNMQTTNELKKHNTMKIFNALRAQESVSRKELAKQTGLSWGSVSAITGELLAKEIAVAEKESSAGGRPADKIALSPRRFLQLGVDINSIGLHFVVVNLRGEVVYSQMQNTESREKDALLDTLFTTVRDILQRFPQTVGINLSMQGKIDRKSGISLRTNFFKDWKNVPLVALFEKAFGVPTALYHDPDCLLAYHLHTDPRLSGAKNGYAVRVDDGIGMARLIDGKLYETGDDTAFELGHIIMHPDGRECACGKRGCLETYASLRGMREIFFEHGGEKSKFATLLKTAHSRVSDVLNVATDDLGLALANLFTLSAPDFILLDGALFSLAPYCFPMLAHKTKTRLCDECNLLLATYNAYAPAVGACLLTVEKKTQEILFG